MITKFKTYKIKINEKFSDVYSLNILINHIRHDSLKELKFYLNNKEYLRIINNKDNDGLTPLMWAAYKGKYNIIDEIIKAGADWNIKDNDGFDFLDYMNISNRKFIKPIIEKYSEKYQEYLLKKDLEQYNL